MSYSNAVYFLDYELGSDAARTALTSVAVANNGAGLVRCTKAAHGLVTGAIVDLSLNYAGAWKITAIDASNFDLIGSTYATATACTVTPRGGSSKADAWKTLTSGATSARIQAGDLLREKESPPPTLVGDAGWVQYNKTITLASAVTANISDCETAWTASTNVTATADTVQWREGTKSMKAVIAAAFVTGKAAYFATGTLDLSAYQQVSFWLLNTVAIASASNLSLRLCTDTTGDVPVHTIPLPVVPSANYWLPVVVNLGTNMNSAIQSVALYQDVDIATITVQIDNIIACKAAASADSITHQSLIGKANALSWVALTAYSAGASRKPTPPNRNGFRYTASAGTSGASEPTWPVEFGLTVVDGTVTWTCAEWEESWHGLQAINGTALTLDGVGPNFSPSTSRGYDGTTETIATYKRETVKTAMAASTATIIHQFQVSGTTAAPITYSGGWDRTNMTTQSGETWFDPQNYNGYFFYNSAKDYITVDNINAVRHNLYYAIPLASGIGNLIKNSHANYGSQGFIPLGTTGLAVSMRFAGFQSNSGGAITASNAYAQFSLYAVKLSGSNASLSVASVGFTVVDGNYVAIKNGSGYAIGMIGAADIAIRNLVTANNATGAVNIVIPGSLTLTNALMSEATVFAPITFRNRYFYSHNHQQVSGSHYIQTDGGTIITATDQLHGTATYARKFLPTSTNRGSGYPLRMAIARVYCAAGVAKSITVYTRRDNANIFGTLKVAGGQLAGIPADITVACVPTVRAAGVAGYDQSSALTFTPTVAGVVEVTFECYDGVGTSNAFWVSGEMTVA